MTTKAKAIRDREVAIFSFKSAVIEALELGATLEELSNALNSLHGEMNPPPEPIKELPAEPPAPKEVLRFSEDEKPNFSSFFMTGEGPSPNDLLYNISMRLVNTIRRNTGMDNPANAGQLLSIPKQRLIEFRGMGPKYFKELKAALIENGYQIYCPATHWIHEKD